jgi:putative NADPH-quinone reductase
MIADDMKVSVILAHPNKQSFNHAIADTVLRTLQSNGYEVYYHDLYSEGFDPLLPVHEISRDSRLDSIIVKHCNEISDAAGIVIIHPNWWGQPPAILKGWIDRVIRVGVAYKFAEGDSGEGTPIGLLTATTALVFNTSDTSEERESQVFSDPLETLWKNCIFGLCGIKNFHRKVYRVIVTSTAEQRQDWLRDVSDTINNSFTSV